jgi:EmrB/QacA subfamily drug resistance transporter
MTTRPEQDTRWRALVVLCAGMLMIVLDATVVNVALPSIQRDLGFSPSGLAWVVNAYLIAFGGLLLLAGRLGDLVSRRGVFLAGLAVFTAASAVCGAAQSPAMLVAARFVQGIGGALTSAVILGMIVTMFPAPREQAKAIGVYGFVASAGGSIGLLLGGVITQVIDWHWIFFVNLPIGVATGACALRLLAHDRGAGLRAGADVPGAVLVTGALMLAVYTIVAERTAAFAGLTLALFVAFIAREATAAHPLMPLRIFRSRTVAGANAVQALSVAGMFGTFFLGALYLQRVLGYDALQTGLAFLPTTLVMGTLSLRYAEALMMRYGAPRLLLPGLGLIAAGLGWFAQVPVHGHYALDVLPALLLLGTGAAVCFPALMTLAMSGATPQDAGLASGLVNTTVQVGGALGLAVLATASASRTHALGGHGAAALVAGYHVGFVLAAGLAVAGLVVALAVLRPARRAVGAGAAKRAESLA